ncbi:MAG: hypothetical protein A3G81_15295 [Betaproteobacteria bacterium RIFCSPLOWO2_12_FULL_65_14]|nr:MAG: hypothetical protein A3G81_15295 [Betaproteobacteria bacterium RIFCSPLOWO2_12_FULL_65_14]
MRVILAAVTLLFAVAATAAGLLAPDRMQLLMPVSPSGAASEVVFPLGHWLAVALWACVVALVAGEARARVVYRCIGVGLALHVLLLLTMFARRLGDPAAFSAPAYWMYARVFSGIVAAGSSAWVLGWLRRVRTDRTALPILDAPIVAGWLVLVAALSRNDAAVAVSALLAGMMAGALLRPGAVAAFVKRAAGNERAFLIGVFVLALGLRLLYLARIMSDPNYLETGADGPVYDELAWSIATGRGIRSTFTDRFPLLLMGYVWFASAVYVVAGHSYFTLCAIQAVLGAWACLLLHSVANQLFGRAVANVAAVFAAVSFPLLFAAAAIGHQAVDVFLTLLIVWLLLRLIRFESRSLWRWAAVGVVFGSAIAVRETNVFFLLFLIVWIPYALAGQWAGSARAVATVAVGVAVVVLPFVAPKVWTAENRQGMRIHFDRLYRGEADFRPMRTELVGPLADPAAALEQFRTDPGRVAGTLARAYASNFAVQYLTQPYGGFDLVFLRKGSEYYYGMWFYAYAFTVAGILIAVRRLPAGGPPAAGVVLVIGLIVSRTIPHLVLESHYRHRVPLEPFLILLAAVGAVALFTRVSGSASFHHEPA